jgi:hypothetical protein
MGKAIDEEVCGLTKLAKGPQGDTPYFRQGPECPTDGCASWGTKCLPPCPLGAPRTFRGYAFFILISFPNFLEAPKGK